MAATAPAVTAALASQILAEHFGLSGALTPLGSERDQNYSVVTAGGERFVLKISNPAESAAVLDFQAQALLHVAGQAPDLPVPHIVPAKDGRPLVRIETPAGPCMVRVVSWLAGVPVSDAPWTAGLRRNLGRTLARLGLALRGYFHPSARHPLLWDVGQAAAVAGLAAHVEDSGAARAGPIRLRTAPASWPCAARRPARAGHSQRLQPGQRAGVRQRS